jgi:[ribulose-bisphosphate carboxylase]-lysine N-methyltransferase
MDTTALDELQSRFEAVENDIAKTCKVKLAPTETNRWGLVATQNVRQGEVLLAMPYDDQFILTPELARKSIFKGDLPESYEGWTGETGLLALAVLNEVARAAGGGKKIPVRTAPLQAFFTAWVQSLPSAEEMDHPLLWSETDQEVLQSSSTNKIYRRLDDLEEDASWLTDNVFAKNRDAFPETVTRNGKETPCYNAAGLTWAMSIAQSRTFFLDGSLRLIPYLDMCNHGDTAEEVRGGYMGTFGTTKGLQLVTAKPYKAGEEVFCSYGPKSAADYLLEHGFVPAQCWRTAVSELTFEMETEDRFYDDKMDILEFETFESAPMEPSQSFDLVSAPGRDGEPDPSMMQFLRLAKLGGTDAFLLESIFRKEVWGFMEYPVSEQNELRVVETITEACERALEELQKAPADGGPEVCALLRKAETKALTRTLEFLQREKEALDLKEYYQERRLKDLGLDSQWSPEDEMEDPDLGFGQTRTPGGADYDW